VCGSSAAGGGALIVSVCEAAAAVCVGNANDGREALDKEMQSTPREQVNLVGFIIPISRSGKFARGKLNISESEIRS